MNLFISFPSPVASCISGRAKGEQGYSAATITMDAPTFSVSHSDGLPDENRKAQGKSLQCPNPVTTAKLFLASAIKV